MTKKTSKAKARKAPAVIQGPAGRGPGFPTRHWQTGKAHVTPAQLAGKSRKVH